VSSGSWYERCASIVRYGALIGAVVLAAFACTSSSDGYASSCPTSGGPLAECPIVPDARVCTPAGCPPEALPTGLQCTAPAQCSILINPGCRTDGYVCSCVNDRWTCNDCSMGTGVCFLANDASADARSDGAVEGGEPCTEGTCGTDLVCEYPMADGCSARGVCVPMKSCGGAGRQPTYCGCDGGSVLGTCDLRGYVTGPVQSFLALDGGSSWSCKPCDAGGTCAATTAP
jgi:hypothetical protein